MCSGHIQHTVLSDIMLEYAKEVLLLYKAINYYDSACFTSSIQNSYQTVQKPYRCLTQ